MDSWIALLWAAAYMAPELWKLAMLVASRWIEVRYAQARGTDREVRELRALIKAGAWGSTATCAGEPIGLCLGPGLAAHCDEKLSERGNTVTIWLCRRRRPAGAERAPLPAGAGGGAASTHAPAVWERSGPFYNIRWTRSVPAGCSAAVDPTPEQEAAAEAILEQARASERNGFGFTTAALLTGPPGAGKSKVAAILAARLRGSVCADHRPTETGDELAHLRTMANPSREAPLVVLMDEWDATVRRIYGPGGEPFRYRDMRPQVCDKASYSAYMDRLEGAANCIFVFTSNLDRAALEAIEPSCVRPGRINLQIAMRDIEGVAVRQRGRFAAPR